MKWRQQQCGLSIIGLVIVMIIVGALAAALVPMFLSKHNQSMTGADRQALEAAKTALIGYALNTGKFPSVVSASGVALMPPSTGTYAALGVNNWGAFGSSSTNQFRMDVNDALASLAAASGVKDLCSVAQQELAKEAAAVGPKVCQDTTSMTTTICSSSAPVAFVLFSTGSNRQADLKNAQTTNTRIYEADNRGIDNTAGTTYYDDQVVSYPLSSLVSACAKLDQLPVCNLNATPSTVASGVTTSVTLTASCSNMSKPPVYNWSTTSWLTPPLASTPAASGITSLNTTTDQTYTVSGTNELGKGATASATVTVFTFSNGSFETNIGIGSFAYDPTGVSSWLFSGGAGASVQNGAWGGAAAAGSYYAFIQNSPSTISQSFTANAGSYTISFELQQRNCCDGSLAQSVNATFDGQSLTGSPFSSVINNWTTYSSTVNVTTSGTHTLSFSGTHTGGDASALLDNVTVTYVGP